MNDLGKRLDDLARNATAGKRLLDPSRGGVAAERPFRSRSLVIAVAAVAAVVAMLVVWQGSDGSSTSVVAGEGEGQEAALLVPGSCDLEAIMPVLRAGIPTYDYQPAGSFAALADQSAAMVFGQIVSAVRAEANGTSFIELTLSDVLDARDGGEPRGDVDVIAYEAVWADRSQPDPLASPMGFTDLTFFGFLSPWSGVRGGWASGPEGLYVGCGNQPLDAVFNDAAGPDDPIGWNADVLAAVFAARGAADDALLAEEQAAAVAEGEADVAQAADESRRADELEALDAALVATENARRIEEERIAALGIDPPTTIAEARALWEAVAITDYRLSYGETRPGNFISGVTVRVSDGVIVDTSFEPSFDEGAVWTVDDLFDLAESVDDIREIGFDRTMGFPTVLSLNPDLDLPGDEFSIREINLVTTAELDAIDARIQAWLPPAVERPIAFQPRSIPQGTEVPQAYLLHELPELDAVVYLADDGICVGVVLKGEDDGDGATEYSDISAASCGSTLGFDTRPLVLRNTSSPTGTDYLIVVQSLDAFDAGWTADADAGRLEVTSRSAILIVDEVVSLSGQIFLEVTCPCGDQTHILPNR